MEKWKDDENVDGLLFGYNHFYGSYSYLADSYNWYRNGVRIIKNNKHIRSFRDALGFRKYSSLPATYEGLLNGGEKLRVKRIDADIYHYGWVKHPQYQQNKQLSFHKMWHPDEWLEKNVGHKNEFDYNTGEILVKFTGTHPAVMQPHIKMQNWEFVYDESKVKITLKEKLFRVTRRIFGWRPGEYHNYKIV